MATTVERVKARPDYYTVREGLTLPVHGVPSPLVGIAPNVGAVVLYKGNEIVVRPVTR